MIHVELLLPARRLRLPDDRTWYEGHTMARPPEGGSYLAPPREAREYLRGLFEEQPLNRDGGNLRPRFGIDRGFHAVRFTVHGRLADTHIAKAKESRVRFERVIAEWRYRKPIQQPEGEESEEYAMISPDGWFMRYRPNGQTVLVPEK